MGSVCSTRITGKGNMSYMSMDGLSSPQSADLGPSNRMLNSLTMAPRKPFGHIRLTSFLHEISEWTKGEFMMRSNRVFGYKFHKPTRVVTLYTTDGLGEFQAGEDECLVFPEKDWSLFYKRVWNDLNDGGEEPLYVAEWDGTTPNVRYRVVGDHTQKRPNDSVYIFCCKDKTKLNNTRFGRILPNEHHDLYEMQFLFKWCDLDLLNRLFSTINKMFKWCDMHDGYNKIKVQLFHPERCARSSTYSLPSPPIHYNHSKAPRSDLVKRRV